jgi:hypothetical protein
MLHAALFLDQEQVASSLVSHGQVVRSLADWVTHGSAPSLRGQLSHERPDASVSLGIAGSGS